MPRFPPLLAVALLALYAAWAFVVPVFEAPDEPAHWQYARYLHDQRSLPHYAKGFEEANSPPLAYVLVAPFAVEMGTPDIVNGLTTRNELASMLPPRTFLNTGEAFSRYWPLRRARLLLALLSLGTVYFTWRAGLAARDAGTGLIAALVVGLLPTFAFRAATVSNDALVVCGAAAVTWGLVRLTREPFAWRVALGTAAAVAIAYLSKISAIALLPPVAFALVAAQPADGWKTRGLRLTALGLAALIVLPWTIRNLQLYGDPFASGAMRDAVAHIITDRSLFDSYFVTSFPRMLTKSFIGVFGWATVILPNWYYAAYILAFAAGAAGVVAGLVRRTIEWRLAAALALCGLAAFAVVVRINLQFTQPQGRYLFPGLPAFAVLMALGWHSLSPAVTRLASPRTIGLGLAAANLYALLGVVWPAYYPAPMRTLDSGVRVVTPSLIADLQIDGPDHAYRIAGPQPSWLSPVDVDAAAFRAFEVELTATATPVAQRGCVRYAVDDGRALDMNPPACFDWMADGRPHRVRATLAGLAGWRGHVTHLRLEPFTGGGAVAGTSLRTREPRLMPEGKGS